jgi:hypothetical protein
LRREPQAGRLAKTGNNRGGGASIHRRSGIALTVLAPGTFVVGTAELVVAAALPATWATGRLTPRPAGGADGEMAAPMPVLAMLAERRRRSRPCAGGRRRTGPRPRSVRIPSSGLVRLPFANVRIAAIDPGDLGVVAAAALTSAEHEGRAYRLSGPESLLPADQVRIVADVLGREIRFEAQSDGEARAEMSGTMPLEYVDAFFKFFADGDLDESQVVPTVEEITGRPPRTYEAWARAHADALREQAAER